MRGNYKAGFKFYLSKKNKEVICPLPGASKVMFIDFREKAEWPQFSVLCSEGCSGREQWANGSPRLWVIYERKEADQMELINGSQDSAAQANEGENREEFS